MRSYRTNYPALACLYTKEFDALNEELSALGDNQSDLIDKMDTALMRAYYTVVKKMVCESLDKDAGCFGNTFMSSTGFINTVCCALAEMTSEHEFFQKLVLTCEKFYEMAVETDDFEKMLSTDVEHWVKCHAQF